MAKLNASLPITYPNGTMQQAFRDAFANLDDYVSGIRSGSAPASAGATGTAGQVRWDSDYIYVCVDTDTWKRAALSTW